MDLNDFLKIAVKGNASDIHLKAGLPPMFRIDGALVPLKDARRMSPEEVSKISLSIMNSYQKEKFKEFNEIDMAYGVPGVGRFRVNVFQQRGTIGVVFRVIPFKILSLEELNLPKAIEKVSMERRGLVLVTGTTGSGKSTTLAAMIDFVNARRTAHILTIEDPIEFLIRDKRCIINQREVGVDTISFNQALRSALRQDPDVILVGEMRDLETIETALQAAETGHLVMSTVHTIDATETVTRIISAFPPYQQKQVRLQLASVIKGIVSQRLVPKMDGKGRVPACEILVSTGRIRELIESEERTKEIKEAIAQGYTSYGMQTFDQSLLTLLHNKLISYEEALRQSTNPDDFALRVKGVSSTSDGSWDDFDKPDKGGSDSGGMRSNDFSSPGGVPMAKKLKAAEIRERFLQFFAKHQHKIVGSGSLVPRMDPTLLFTNAGMNQFKAVFTGEETRDYRRATSTQKCVRAGGKHNDLENVGRTARHHTFFEMLGNFSFGDYFKKEAIGFAWEFVTKDLRLPKDKLYVSVFEDDDESFALWHKDVGLDKSRIYRFGTKDNFWAMGDTGPCGPCSEIFFDQGEKLSCGRSDCDVGCDCDRYIEFWNLVFMEFAQQADGTRTKLPKPSIDTGMGLERVAAIVQQVENNYDTDLFVPILEKIGQFCGIPPKKADQGQKVSMRVIADHIRAMTFLMADGVNPSNEGRGYVVRRIMRRAMRHGRKLGLTDPFLFKLSAEVVQLMAKTFPELKTNQKITASMIELEEKRFAQTIDRGLQMLSDEIAGLKKAKETILNGETTFRLYDTYGFPVDLTADVLREHDLTYDHEGFEEAFARHREKARGSWKGSEASAVEALAKKWVQEGFRSEFLGYTDLETEGEIRYLVRGGKLVAEASEGDEVELIADRTPFYGESGGQVGDIGTIFAKAFSLEVIDTKKVAPEVIVHRCRVVEGKLATGVPVRFSVDPTARAATAKNHTATHMLHATLKEVLGNHVKQEGSWVAPERLRFDFTHPRGLTAEELATIERAVNERIWLDTEVQKDLLPLDQALASGAVALFDEKYGDQVRVLTMGNYSKELCGGTHLDRTGEVGLFKFVKESAVAAGIRRVEAFTGHRALRHVEEMDRSMHHMGNLLGVSVAEIGGRVEKLLQRQRELEKEVRKLRAHPSSSGFAKGAESITDIKGVKVLVAEAEACDPRDLRTLADQSLAKLRSGVVAIGSKKNGKAFVVVKVSKDLIKQLDAGTLVQEAAKVLGGSGGGRPDMAQAGGPSVNQLSAALATIPTTLKKA